MSDWFDPEAGVVLMHPCDLKTGMRLASRRIDENDRQVTVLTPLWTAKHDSGRTSDGEFHSWRSFSPDSGVRVWAHPEIRPEFMPPHEGTWITNIPSSRYSTEYTDGARTLRTEVLGGRTYTLHRKADRSWGRASWVIREEHGERWFGPSRDSHDLAEEQFDAIMAGKAW